MLEEAKKKINGENLEGSLRESLEKIRFIIDGWLDYDESAAELVMNQEKSINGAYQAMRKEAQANAKNNAYCMDGAESVRLILEYFGVSKDKAQELIEGGLMFCLMQRAVETWKPYDPKALKPQTSAPASGGGLNISLEDLL